MTQGACDEFAEFYDATWGRTLACTYAMTGDLGIAEELAQEAYTRAWTRWSQLTSYDEPGAWVRQVATRLAVSRWRRTKVAQAWHARNRRESVVAPPDETSAALVAALRQLPEAQRRAIVLHHLGDLPVDEVARIEKCPSGTVKARLSRGRAALALLLADAPAPSPSNHSQNGEPSHV
jgi:RNA polymerase sigma-70 factor (ECF subfamily)